jgi:hypothetical protein
MAAGAADGASLGFARGFDLGRRFDAKLVTAGQEQAAQQDGQGKRVAQAHVAMKRIEYSAVYGTTPVFLKGE